MALAGFASVVVSATVMLTRMGADRQWAQFLLAVSVPRFPGRGQGYL